MPYLTHYDLGIKLGNQTRKFLKTLTDVVDKKNLNPENFTRGLINGLGHGEKNTGDRFNARYYSSKLAQVQLSDPRIAQIGTALLDYVTHQERSIKFPNHATGARDVVA